MRRLKLIGIGAGDPDYITVQAINALQQLDVVFITDKGRDTQALRHARTTLCERYMRTKPYRLIEIKDPVRDRAAADYRGSVTSWHGARATLYEEALVAQMSDSECGGFLVWGDPALYDSTLRIVERLAARGRVAFDWEVVPGITATQALAARHRIPLNQIAEPVHITTGRRLEDEAFKAGTNVVVMLDGECAFKHVACEDMDIYWGAYIGTPDEILLSGKLRDMSGQIEEMRARARQQHGWIMDTYILCKRATCPENSDGG